MEDNTIRNAARTLFASDPYVADKCPQCKLDVSIPKNASYIVCGCGHVLRDLK